jgi:hypothetical protein
MEQKSPGRLHAIRNQNCLYQTTKHNKTQQNTTSLIINRLISLHLQAGVRTPQKQPGLSLIKPGRQNHL